MSQMTSMLHDQDRNDKYELAIAKRIGKYREETGQDPQVRYLPLVFSHCAVLTFSLPVSLSFLFLRC